MPGGRGSGLGSHRAHVAGVDHADLPLAGRGTETARPGDRGRQRQDVLHVGIRSQQRRHPPRRPRRDAARRPPGRAPPRAGPARHPPPGNRRRHHPRPCRRPVNPAAVCAWCRRAGGAGGGSACRCPDPQPVAVRVAKLNLTPIGRFISGPAELVYNGVKVRDYQVDRRNASWRAPSLEDFPASPSHCPCDLVVGDGGLAVDEVVVIFGVKDGDLDVLAREAFDVRP